MARPTLFLYYSDSQYVHIYDVAEQVITNTIPYHIYDTLTRTGVYYTAHGIVHRSDEASLVKELLDGQIVRLLDGTQRPVIYADSTRIVYNDEIAGEIVAIATQTGAPLWNTPYPGGNGPYTAEAVAVATHILYYSVGDTIERFDLTTGASTTHAAVGLLFNGTLSTFSDTLGNGWVVGTHNGTPGDENIVKIDNTFTLTLMENANLITPDYSPRLRLVNTDYTSAFGSGAGAIQVWGSVGNVVYDFDVTADVVGSIDEFCAFVVVDKLYVYVGVVNAAPHDKFYIYDIVTETLEDTVDLSATVSDIPNSEGELAAVAYAAVPTYTIAGNITNGGSPASTTVYLVGSDNKTIHTTTSNGGTGDYTFRTYSNNPFSVVALHPTNGNSLIASNIVPVVEV